MICSCNHTFCLSCLQQLTGSCPICRKDILDYRPNLALQTVIDQVEVPCTNEGCTTLHTVELLPLHLKNCLFLKQHCQFAKYGCSFIGILASHNCDFVRIGGFIMAMESKILQLEQEVSKQNNIINSLQKSDLKQPTRPDLWFDGKITCSKTFYSLQGGVTSLITTSDELYAGTYDGSIQRFDIKSGDLQQSVDAHTLSVWSLAIDQQYNLIYSTGSDETIKVWDRELNEICSLESNQGKIYRLLLDNNILFSASSKGVVKIWDTISRECIGQMLGHTGGVNSMKRYRDKLITASSDKTIKIWDIETCACVDTVQGTRSEFLDVTTSGDLLFGSTYDAKIIAYNMNDLSQIGVLTGHNWEVWALASNEYCLFSGSHDHTIKRWDIRQLQCNLDLAGHRGFIHTLQLNGDGLMSASADKTIKLWK